jgi:hypothetical protein
VVEGVAAVERDIDRQSLPSQTGCHGHRELGVILDEQQSHPYVTGCAIKGNNGITA